MAGFQKKVRGVAAKKPPPEIPGTKQSLKTFSLLTSSGIPSLDALVGGGFPLGSIVVLNQDDVSAGPDYTKVILNHFLSAGMSQHGHDIFVASGSNKPIDKVNIMQPASSSSAKSNPTNLGKDDLDLKIAWRYRDMKEPVATPEPVRPVEAGGKTGSMTSWGADQIRSDFNTNSYLSLFKSLHGLASEACYGGGQALNVLRIGLFDLDTVLMAPDDDLRFLLEFMFALKSLVRHKLAVAVVSLTSSRSSDDGSPAVHQSLKELCDFWFDVRGLEQKDAGGYHGFFSIAKLPVLRTLKSTMASSYGRYHFKSTKSKFVLEKIHLPPAEFEQPQNSQDKPKSAHAIGSDW